MIKDIEYWAGLADADGSFNLMYSKRPSGLFYTQLSFNLYQKDKTILEEFNKYFGVNINVCNKQDVHVVRITGEKARWFYSQVKPYLVIKKPLVLFLERNDKKHLTQKEKDTLVQKIKVKRYSNTHNYKHDNTPAWSAGFIDGDGCFTCNYKKGDGSLGFVISVVSHKDQSCGLQLLKSFYGGSISKDCNCNRWRMSLSDKSLHLLMQLRDNLKIKKSQCDFIIKCIEEEKHKKVNGATKESNLLLKQELSSMNKR